MGRRSKGMYVPLSVRFFRDPKVLGVPAAAKLLYLAGLCYAKEEHTDGFIPRACLEALLPGERGLPRHAKLLADVGLWVAAEGGWVIPAWEGWNLTEGEVRAQSAKRKAAAEARWQEKENQA